MARVSISAVWDRTTEFMSERTSAVLAVAAPVIAATLFAGELGQRLFATTPGMGPGMSGLVPILLQLPLLWAQLQVMALAIDPAVTPAEAVQRATNRLGAALLLWLVLLAVVIAAMLPVVALVLASGLPLDRLATLGPNPPPEAIQALIPPSAAPALLFALLYLMAAAVVIWVLYLRWGLVYVVTLVEAIGLPALGRSWRLTRGMTLALLGVSLLYALVAVVTALAAQTVVGTLLGLIFGRDGGLGVAGLGSALVSALVGAVMTVLATGFLAKFYLAARRAEDLG